MAAFALVLGGACGDDGASDDGEVGQPTASAAVGDGDCETGERTTDSGLVIEDVECGEGPEATTGSTVTVHYVGTLEDGKKFDASRDHGEPFGFLLGAGQVIAGWDEGVEGMLVGGTRNLTIPPELGYGEAGYPPAIPENATLLFTIELLAVEKPS
ncbi:MAG: FKBP-type peptidyl-prolyl cis-trans isomerase [Actinomycetota bacterium]